MQVVAKINDKKIKELFAKLQASAKDTAPAMRSISQVLLESAEDNFAAEGRFPKWAALEAGTIAQRKKKGTWPGKILQQRGHLASSVHAEYTKWEAVAGSNSAYARIHQLGGTIKHPGGTPYFVKDGKAVFMKKDGTYPAGTKFTQPHDIKIPARPYLSMRAGDVREAEDILTRHLLKGI
jgi:phage virion morphogenesis protein